MAQIAGPERSNVFLVRCNFEPSTPLGEVAELISTPERSLSSRLMNCWAAWVN